MGTKGESPDYEPKRNVKPEYGKINFDWADGFAPDEDALKKHFDKHGKSVKTKNTNEYFQKAEKFANNYDLFTVAFIDKRGLTQKFNTDTNEFGTITPERKIITYFKPKNKNYWNNMKRKNGFEGKKDRQGN